MTQAKTGKIQYSPPKLQWLVKLFFPGYDFNKVVGFAFGDTIYTRLNPLPEWNLVHERTHLRQMRYSRLRGVFHFIKFVMSRKFRYRVELEAYRNEYRFIKTIASPVKAYNCAEEFAKVLAGIGENAYVYGKTEDYDVALFDITT